MPKRLLLPTLLALAACLVLAPAALGQGGQEDEKKLKSADRDRPFLLKVNEAIEKGKAYLRSMQQPDGTWRGVWANFAEPYRYPMGETALALLALLKSGENRNSEVVEKGFRWLRKQPLKKTYEVSTLVLALEARYAKQDVKSRIEELTQAVRRVPIAKQDLDWMKECIRFLLEHREMSWRLFGMDNESAKQIPDSWHYPGPSGSTTDHSNTQFALLALKSGSRCGIPIPDDVWIKTVMHFVETQEKEGKPVRRIQLIESKEGYRIYKPVTSVPDHARGWCYSAAQNGKTGSKDKMSAATGSMTCVGVASLAIAVSELPGRKLNPGLRDKAETGMRDGLAWLDEYWTVEENPFHPEKFWHYYYLYGIERAAVMTGRRNIGKRDWYREGAEYLLRVQKGDGQWNDPNCNGPINNTCFALLFLTKATVPVGTVITGRH